MARTYSHGAGTTARVYTFDAVDDWRWPDDAMDQLHRAHRLKNALVAAEREHEQARADAWQTIPEVAAAHARAAQARQKVADADDAVAHASQQLGWAKHHGRDVAAAQAELASAEGDRKQLVASSREAAADVRAAERAHKSAVKPLLDAAAKARDEQATELRKQAIADGLLWSTAGDVADKHRVRVARVIALRAQGRPAELRFRRWDGEGTITVILQRQQDKPQRTPELIADGDRSPWRNDLWLWPWMPPDTYAQLPRGDQRRLYKQGRVRLKLRARNTEAGPAWVDVPVYVHRMIPADADIVSAQLVRRVVGTRTKTHLCVTVRIPQPEDKTAGPVVAVHTGWRVRQDGSLRVAVWQSGRPLTLPGHLAEVLVPGEDGMSGEVIAPARWRSYHRKISDVSSIRAQHRDAIRGKLAAWLAEHGPVAAPWTSRDGEPVELTAAVVERWVAPARFARLANAWRQTPPSNGGEIVAMLGEWLERDRHLWAYHAGGVGRLVSIRRDRWRRVAAWLADQAGEVVVDGTDLASVSRRRSGDEEAREAARRNRVIASPGELRTAVRLAADSRGVPVRLVDADGITTAHRECGHRNVRDEEHAASVVVSCRGCGGGYDQDVNAVGWLLAVAKGESPPKSRGRVRGEK